MTQEFNPFSVTTTTKMSQQIEAWQKYLLTERRLSGLTGKSYQYLNSFHAFNLFNYYFFGENPPSDCSLYNIHTLHKAYVVEGQGVCTTAQP